MFNFLIKILDFIYRKKCYICGKSSENSILCSKCYDKINFLTFSACRIISGIKIYSACYYEKEMQKIIRGVKYHNQRELAKFQARIMYDYFSKTTEKDLTFAVVPVPLHKNRQKQRRYNHMELVGQELCLLTGWELKTDLIERIKDTKPQYKLSFKDREQNLKDAFKIYKENYNNENILLIDDILTTGSTFGEIINSLKAAGISKITGFTASTVHGGSVNIY